MGDWRRDGSNHLVLRDMTDRSTADAAQIETLAQGGDEIAGIVLQLLSEKADREGRIIEPADLLEGAGAMLESAWHLAKMAGPEHRLGYAAIVRSHAEAIEALS